jgi:sec-independent protein translocase protein TatC
MADTKTKKDAHNGADGMAEGPEDDQPMSFFDHLAELRSRLMRAALSLTAGVTVCYIFVDKLTQWLLRPFGEAWMAVQASCKIDPELACLSSETPRLQNLSPFESVMVDIRIAMVGGLFLAAPVVFYELWGFIAPGLYKREKKMVVPFAATSAVMFAVGGWFCYEFVLPVATEFLLEYGLRKDGGENPVQIMAEYTYSDHIQYTTRLLLGFGLIFEFPLAVFFLASAGVITHKTLLRHWKIMVVAIFIVAAFLTPPEPISQILMAMPMCALYALSIGVAYLVGKPERERLAKLEAELAKDAEDEDD